MALDAQRNWTVSMAENLERLTLDHEKGKAVLPVIPSDTTTAASTLEMPSFSPDRPPIHLPSEVLINILEQLDHDQPALAACALLSHQWYTCAVPLLYARPRLYGNNFDPFVRAICPSINLHVRRSPLSELVKVLDLRNLVHQGSRSITARLLGRTKSSLEVFRAPQASFAVNCLPALGKCTRLAELDLALVSESPPLPDLFRTVSHLASLATLRLPRSAGFGVHHSSRAFFAWPPNLASLTLSGGIDAHFLHGVVAFPQTLTAITLEHCPQAKAHAVTHLLRTALQPLRNLRRLTIAHMPRLGTRALDDLLFLLPQITHLSVAVDYITPALFDESSLSHLKAPTPHLALPSQIPSAPTGDPTNPSDPSDPAPLPSLSHHPLHTLTLTSSGSPGTEDKISPLDILIALDEGALPALRVVRVARSLLWHASATVADAEALADVLAGGRKGPGDGGLDEEGGEGGEGGEGIEGEGEESEGEREGTDGGWEGGSGVIDADQGRERGEGGVWMIDG